MKDRSDNFIMGVFAWLVIVCLGLGAVTLCQGCGSGGETLFSGSASGSSSAGSGAGGATSSSTEASGSSSAGSSSATGGGLFWASGVLPNLPTKDLVGWTECYSGLYADTGVSMTKILTADCTQAKLLLACRQKGAATLQVAAMGNRADVSFLFPKDDISSVHEANGVGWYITAQQWGFVPAGDQRLGSAFDVTGISPAVPGPDGDKRVSWSGDGAGNLAVGYRCGFGCYENTPGFDYNNERVVFEAP